MNADGTAYNKGNNRGAKVGNWVEENALEERTGYHRSAALYGPTFERVLADKDAYCAKIETAKLDPTSKEARKLLQGLHTLHHLMPSLPPPFGRQYSASGLSPRVD